MGYADAWAALNLDMPRTIPRTEYSVEGHYDLLRTVTGMTVTQDSPREVKDRVRLAFRRAWDFGFAWSVMVGGGHIKGRRTDMGHAVYAAGGTDWRDTQHCPFTDPAEVLAYDPVAEAGSTPHADLVAAFERHYAQAQTYDSDVVNMSGTYITLFSGLIEIFGWEMLLLAAGTDPAGFGAMTRRYEAWIRPFFEAFAASTVPVMMVHDDICWTSGPVLDPAWYREYVFPAYRRLWRPVLDAGKRLVFTSDGDYTMFFDDIVACGAHGLVMEPCADMAGFARRHGRTHAFIGNADTRVLLSGPISRIEAEVQRCLDIGRDCPGFIMAVGNHIPANTPVEHALAYQRAFERGRRR